MDPLQPGKLGVGAGAELPEPEGYLRRPGAVIGLLTSKVVTALTAGNEGADIPRQPICVGRLRLRSGRVERAGKGEA